MGKGQENCQRERGGKKETDLCQAKGPCGFRKNPPADHTGVHPRSLQIKGEKKKREEEVAGEFSLNEPRVKVRKVELPPHLALTNVSPCMHSATGDSEKKKKKRRPGRVITFAFSQLRTAELVGEEVQDSLVGDVIGRKVERKKRLFVHGFNGAGPLHKIQPLLLRPGKGG